MIDTRLQRLEALLGRVRRRAAEARSGLRAPAAPFAAAASTATQARPPARGEPAQANIPTSPPPPLSAPRSLPVQAPESGWPEAPVVPAAAPLPVAPPAPPASHVTAAGSAPNASVLELVDNPPLETLDEEDLLEIPSDMLESVPPNAGYEAPEEVEEEPPASSQRPRAAHLDDLEQASAALSDEGREVPLKTPPPESGPQAAPPLGLGAPPPVNIDGLLEADLIQPPVAAVSEQISAPFDALEQPFGSRPPPPASGPTMEQLGQTVELEEARGPDLELDRPLAPPPVVAPPDELEAHLPEPHSDGFGEPAEVALPSAVPELSKPLAPPPLATMRAAAGEANASADVTHGVPIAAELVQRPALSSSGVMSVSTFAAKSEPRTFLQLLDASIALGK